MKGGQFISGIRGILTYIGAIVTARVKTNAIGLKHRQCYLGISGPFFRGISQES